MVTSSLNPSTAGSATTFTATITGASPTGTVTFKDGTNVLGNSAVSSGVAVFTTSSLGAATHSISAEYSGDSGNAGSTGSLSQVVNISASGTALTVNPSVSTAGASVTFTASVTGFSPGGTVSFKDGAATLGTASLNAGVAAFTTSALAVGSHTISAAYGGDINNTAGTSSAMDFKVFSRTPSVTFNLPLSASTGGLVTLRADITGASPTGTVSFKEGATTLGSAAVVAGANNTLGVATFSYSAFTAGSHTIVASYSGDTLNDAVVSSSSIINVNQVGVGPASTQTYQYGYDAKGRLTTSIDPLGNASYIYYDALGRPIQTQQPAGAGQITPTITEMAYNDADSLTKVRDPRLLETTYNPNGLGQVVSQTSPDSGAASFTYDANGNLLTATDARGKVSTMAYDVSDRPTSIAYPTGTPTTMEYDGGAAPYAGAKGELTKVTDESGSQTYAYDSAGRLISKTQVTLGNPTNKTFTVSYTWGDTGSSMDKVTAVTYPSGNRVNYAYDAKGAVTAVTVNAVNANGVGVSGTTTGVLSGITLNASQNITGWSWNGGLSFAETFDTFGLLASYSMGPAQTRTVARDAAGRITGYTHSTNGSVMNQSFVYDALNRLTNVNLSGNSTSYSYDATNNRTSKVVNGTTYTNAISATSNRQVTIQDVGGTFNVSYDAAGHVTSDDVNTYNYSDRGRMSSAVTAGGTVNYKYNALDQRVSKTGPVALVPTSAAYFVYDEAGKLLGEYDASGAPIYETVYLGMTPVAAIKQTGTAAGSNIAVTVYNVHSDHLGAPRVITRQSDNAIMWRWDTAESYGGTAPDQNPTAQGVFAYNVRFPGQTYDAETGLFQNWRREYNPRIGRYMQSDPVGLEGGINTYEYVGGAPTMFVDPTGQWVANVVGAVAGGLGVGAAAYMAGGDAWTIGLGFGIGAVSGALSPTAAVAGVAEAFGGGAGGMLAAQILMREVFFTLGQVANQKFGDQGRADANCDGTVNWAKALTKASVNAIAQGATTGKSVLAMAINWKGLAGAPARGLKWFVDGLGPSPVVIENTMSGITKGAAAATMGVNMGGVVAGVNYGARWVGKAVNPYLPNNFSLGRSSYGDQSPTDSPCTCTR